MEKSLPGSRKTLSAVACMEREDAGRRFAWMVGQIYAGDSVAKRFSREFGVSLATAEKIVAGTLPQNATLIAACRKYGRAFMDFVVFGPVDFDREAAAEARIAALQVQLDMLKAQERGN